MKKRIKSLSIITMILAIILSYTTNTNAIEQTNNTKLVGSSISTVTLEDTIKKSTYNNLMAGDESSDSSYNINDTYDITVKNQRKIGSCWAFAYTSMVETTIKDQNEYSPMHMEYKTTEMYGKNIAEGGNNLEAMAYSANGYGPVYESDLPFESVYDEKKYSVDSNYLADPSTVDLSKISAKLRVEDASYYPYLYKTYNSDGTITYKNDDSLTAKTYTTEEVNAIRALIKKHIKETGAVTAGIYMDITIDSNGVISSKGKYYNSETNAFYSNATNLNANHAVTIIGWDDTYKKENFSESCQPANDGAYIVLNSYGDQFGDNGIFYVSYDDFFIEQQIFGINSISKNTASTGTTYEYIYDELGMNHGIKMQETISGKTTSTIYGANVFTKKDASHIESLNEVGIFLLTAEGVKVYVNPESDDLNNCKLVADYTGDNALEAGYHVLKLSSPIDLTGEKFVVKIEYVNQEGASVPIEMNYKSSGAEDMVEKVQSELYSNATSNPGESYCSGDGYEWTDLYGTDLGDGIIVKDSNVCIKAYTVQGNEKVSVQGVSLDKSTMSMQVGDSGNLVATVTPLNAQNKNVTWSSSDPNVVTISEDGIITAKSEGNAVITVTTLDGNYTATCNVSVNAKSNNADDIYKVNDTENENVSVENVESSGSATKPLPKTGTNNIVPFCVSIGVFIVIAFLNSKNKKYKNIK